MMKQPTVNHILPSSLRKELRAQLAAFDELLAEKPGNVEAMTCRLEILVQLGEWRKAVKYARHILKTSPDNAVPWYFLGVCQGMQGKYASALSSFLKCQRLDPTNYRTGYHIAEAYLKLNEPGKALEIANDHILRYGDVRECDNHVPFMWLLRVRAQLRLGDRTASAASFAEALNRYPRHPILQMRQMSKERTT